MIILIRFAILWGLLLSYLFVTRASPLDPLVAKAHSEEQGVHVLLVTAHPDDEAMFFSPLLETVRLYNENLEKGLGKYVEQELEKSGAPVDAVGSTKNDNVSSGVCVNSEKRDKPIIVSILVLSTGERPCEQCAGTGSSTSVDRQRHPFDALDTITGDSVLALTQNQTNFGGRYHRVLELLESVSTWSVVGKSVGWGWQPSTSY